MDGVIIDSETRWQKKELTFFEQFADQWTSADQQAITGSSIHDIYGYISKKYSLSLSEAEFFKNYDQAAQTIYGQETQLLPGVIDLLRQIKDSSLSIALASSSPHSWINIVLNRFNLRGFFKAVISSDDVQSKGKPAPDIYLFTAKKLKLKPQKCLVIEDSINGVKAAKAAGMSCIWLKVGRRINKQKVKADKIVSSHQEIIQYLTKSSN
jgi:HAD superfamily hydrolase (TIGR01509 family)